MKNNVLKTIKFLLGWPLSLLAIFFLLKLFTPQMPVIVEHIRHANMFVFVLSIVAFQLYFLFRVLLWKHILGAKGHEVPLKNTSWYWSTSEISRYVPGNIWSILGRGVNFAKFGVNKSTLLVSWGQESLLVLLGSTLVGLFGIAFAYFSLAPSFPLKDILFWIVVTGIWITVVLWVVQQGFKNLSYVHEKIKSHVLSFQDASTQLLLGVVSFFFFGLGTYLSIASLFYLPLQNITELIGLFALSFTVGYISIITPMGLGVRELVISKGLSWYLPAGIVGFAALFARFMLIASELLFLGISYVFYKVRFAFNRSNVFKHVTTYKYEYLVALSIFVYIAYFTTASFYRYTNFFTGRFDLGNMDQTVWNTIHGQIFELTDPNGTNIMSRLGTHADFILVVLAPFYLLWEDPRMLLLIQSVVLGMGGLFVYLIAKDTIKNKTFALVASIAYLINPSLEYTNLYDFHAVALATTFFLAVWYFMKKKKYVWMGIFLLLAGLTKEEAWLAVGLFGIYLFLFEKKRIIGIVITLFSFGAFYALVWKFIPLARGGQHFALSYYADYGSTPTSVIKNIVLSPWKILGVVLGPTRLIYLLQLLLPVGFLALLVPQFLIFALPDLGINLLSSNAQFHQITYQYTAVITPFLFIAAISAVAFLIRKHKKVSIALLSWLLLGSAVVGAYAYGPLPGAKHPSIDMFVKQEDDRQLLETFLKEIPPQYSVAATNNIGSHLSHRQKIFTIPVGIDQADIIVFLLNDPFAQPSLKAQKEMAAKLQTDPRYTEAFHHNDFIIFEKKGIHIENP